MAESARLRRGGAERLLAWIYTGPLGRLWGGVVDLAVLLVRIGWARLRARTGRA
ncbi:MAG: hypothetical protein H0U42_07635 [Thermoleophilaceae bacterium]|nr:hypothetical protein [Thermoleophilaceae bacterium]